MKKVNEIILDIQKNGMPQYVKQSIEIFIDGHVNHCLYPMVYLGEMKKYEFEISTEAIEEFFNEFDFSAWTEIDKHTSDSASYILKVFYDDQSVVVKKGYINSQMPKEYVQFDEKLLDLIYFIEKPWSFSV